LTRSRDSKLMAVSSRERERERERGRGKNRIRVEASVVVGVRGAVLQNRERMDGRSRARGGTPGRGTDGIFIAFGPFNSHNKQSSTGVERDEKPEHISRRRRAPATNKLLSPATSSLTPASWWWWCMRGAPWCTAGPPRQGGGACPDEDTFRDSPHTRVNQTRRNALRTSKHSNALWWSTAEPDLYKCITAPRKVRGPRRERRQRAREREREREWRETSAQVQPLVRDLSACLPSLGVRAAQELMRLRDSLIDGRNEPRGFVRFIIFYNESSTSRVTPYQSSLAR